MMIEVGTGVAAIFSTTMTIIGSIVTYELIEVRRKRKVETYWKIESEYKAQKQEEARKLIGEVKKSFDKLDIDDVFMRDKVYQEYYINQWQNNSERAEDAKKIRHRIRFLHECGFLLKKRMIDEDLLFSLIGMGFTVQYKILVVILDAYRREFGTHAMYNDFDYLWVRLLKWNRKE